MRKGYEWLRTFSVLILDGLMLEGNNVARVLQTLDLIQGHPGIGASALSSRLGVSTRAVRRNVATLRDAGFAIASTPGPAGGYRVQRGPRMSLIFTQEELTTLAMSLVESAGAVSGESATTAASKILHGLPARAAAPARSVLEAATNVPGGTPSPSPDVVLQLATAIEQSTRVEVGYRPADSSETHRRIVDPWGLVVRHRRWYLLGHSPTRAATRTYRVDRIHQVQLLSERCALPVNIDIAAAFEEHLQNSWQFVTHVDIQAPADEARAWTPFTMGTLTSTGPDSCRLDGRTNNCEAYVTDLLQTPLPFSIRGGPELLAAVTAIRSRL